MEVLRNRCSPLEVTLRFLPKRDCCSSVRSEVTMDDAASSEPAGCCAEICARPFSSREHVMLRSHAWSDCGTEQKLL